MHLMLASVFRMDVRKGTVASPFFTTSEILLFLCMFTRIIILMRININPRIYIPEHFFVSVLSKNLYLIKL